MAVMGRVGSPSLEGNHPSLIRQGATRDLTCRPSTAVLHQVPWQIDGRPLAGRPTAMAAFENLRWPRPAQRSGLLRAKDESRSAFWPRYPLSVTRLPIDLVTCIQMALAIIGPLAVRLPAARWPEVAIPRSLRADRPELHAGSRAGPLDRERLAVVAAGGA